MEAGDANHDEEMAELQGAGNGSGKATKGMRNIDSGIVVEGIIELIETILLQVRILSSLGLVGLVQPHLALLCWTYNGAHLPLAPFDAPFGTI